MKAVPTSRSLVFAAIALVGCLADLATKSWIFGRLGPPPIHRPGPILWVAGHFFGFQTNLNEGALFGMGQGFVPVFAGLSVLALTGILFWLFYFGAARQWLLCVALGCVSAGILGNLYDRLGLPSLKWGMGHPLHSPGEPVHAVRDWILVMIGKWPWPTFNIADSLLVCGAALLVWHAFCTPPELNPSTVAETHEP